MIELQVKAESIEQIDHQWLAEQWQMLTAQIPDAPIFLSWSWQHAFLTSVKSQLSVLFFYDEGRLVGLTYTGITTKFFAGVRQKKAWLHQTGNSTFDQSWIEYNDILALDEYAFACRRAYLNWCEQQNIDCVHVRTSQTEASAWQDNVPSQHIETVPAYKTLLPSPAATLDDVLAKYSKNTRAQIRRAIKYIENKYGAIELQKLTHSDAVNTLPALGQYHRERWQDSDYGSGFNNPVFIEFHKQLLTSADANVDYHILKFNAGNFVLGYLYNFMKDGHVYFYLSGLNYSDPDNKYKVGLVLHALAMTDYANKGAHTYDFMGGQCRYKSSLSNQQYSFYHIEFEFSQLKRQAFKSIKKMEMLFSSKRKSQCTP